MIGQKILIAGCWFVLAVNVFALAMTILFGGSMIVVNLFGIGISIFAIRLSTKTLKDMKRRQGRNTY